jgi:hypothetical protein
MSEPDLDQNPAAESDEPSRWRHLAIAQQFFDRHVWLVPAGSFAVGWIGFFMVQRGADLARWVALIAIIGWPWLLLEPFVRRALQRWRNNRLPIVVVNFISQSIQQELLFFSLPLMIGATQLDVGQIVFAALTIIAALISTLDPIYESHIAKRPVIRLTFHAWCSWVAALVVLPMVAKVPIERALPLSLVVLGVWIAITIPNLLAAKQSWRQRSIWLVVLLLAPPLLWLARGHIPAAGLSVREAVITRSIEQLVPGTPTKVFAAAELPQGVIAFVAIRAPMGVAQSVIFEWCHTGDCERIASEVRGTEGYWRTYSRKQNFPQDAVGKWTVDVLTPEGQLLKRMRFDVR